MSAASPALDPGAERLAAALLALVPASRATAALDEIEAAYDEVMPGGGSGRRRRIGELIAELEAAGFLVPSRKLDRREAPALPTFVRLELVRPTGRACPEARTFPWRPELRWAADLGITSGEFETLRLVHEFLRRGGARRIEVPAAERSLDIFGHEKELDRIRATRLWRDDRLSFALLRCRRVAAPFSYRLVGEGSWLLVAENEATSYSLAEAIGPASQVGAVAFGGGGLFRKSVEWAVEFPAATGRPPIEAIRYIGDLDAEGLRIPIAASAAAEALGLPPVRPAVGLYSRMLRDGLRETRPPLDPELAVDLAAWFPPPLAREVSDVLVGGARIAQEKVGLEWLTGDRRWQTSAGLGAGRRGAPRVSRPTRAAAAGETAGEADARWAPEVAPPDPTPAGGSATGRAGSVSVSATRNNLLGDPLLDWLELYGAAAGFVRDDEQAGYDARFDFRRFVTEQGARFEAGILAALERDTPLTRVARPSGAAERDAAAVATLEALRRGDPLVAGAVLVDAAAGMYGIVDLLVRSDVLAERWPEALGPAAAGTPAPRLGEAARHYRVVEIKFHRMSVLADGGLAGEADVLPFAGQAWLHNESLGRLQGYRPEAAYLLGRGWSSTTGADRGNDAFERLARVDAERDWHGVPLGELALDAVAWARRLREDGASWSVLPTPSVTELYPHAGHHDDTPWHAAKAAIARELAELTLLPRMNPRRRADAFAAGIARWDDPRLDAKVVGLAGRDALLFEAVRAANMSAVPVVLPEHIGDVAEPWRDPAPVEFYVDLETVSDLDDDFEALPDAGGQPLVFQIGCGHLDRAGTWRFAQCTVTALDPASERPAIDAWFAHMASVCAEHGVELGAARVIHWSPAETAWIDGGEAGLVAARRRHPEAAWPAVPWLDLLNVVMRAEPVTMTGAFGFGLKAVTRAMQAAGLVATAWGDGPPDGLGAMVGAWRAAKEAAERGVPLADVSLMDEIAGYNEVDCRAMADVLGWLRRNR